MSVWCLSHGLYFCPSDLGGTSTPVLTSTPVGSIILAAFIDTPGGMRVSSLTSSIPPAFEGYNCCVKDYDLDPGASQLHCWFDPSANTGPGVTSYRDSPRGEDSYEDPLLDAGQLFTLLLAVLCPTRLICTARCMASLVASSGVIILVVGQVFTSTYPLGRGVGGIANCSPGSL